MAGVRSTIAALATLLVLLAGGGSAAAASPAARLKGQSQATKWKLVWSDGFGGAPGTAPNPRNWGYVTGHHGGMGNQELETYCGYGVAVAPCNRKNPNVYVANGDLHIVARNPAPRVYTSARLTTRGLRSFKYGKIEARIKMPFGQGMWPAFWMLGNDIKTNPWPACGEIDIMESIGRLPFTNVGSIHGTGFTGKLLSRSYTVLHGPVFASRFHVFGIIWGPNKIQFYVDDPDNVYAAYTPAMLPKGAVWPFNAHKFFIVLNLAVGGDWPGSPSMETVFPQQMLVDYVRVYERAKD